MTIFDSVVQRTIETLQRTISKFMEVDIMYKCKDLQKMRVMAYLDGDESGINTVMKIHGMVHC